MITGARGYSAREMRNACQNYASLVHALLKTLAILALFHYYQSAMVYFAIMSTKNAYLVFASATYVHLLTLALTTQQPSLENVRELCAFQMMNAN